MTDSLTFPELFDLPVTVDMKTAAAALGISMTTAYRLAQQGAFPCAYLRLGNRYRIPTSRLMFSLGIELEPVDARDVAAGAAFAAELDAEQEDGS